MKQYFSLFWIIILSIGSLPKVSPAAVFGEILSDESRSANEMNVVPQQRTTTRIKKDIKIKTVTFSCGFTIYHTRTSVNMDTSKFSCTPSKPSKQNALKVVLVGTNGFSFKANIQINPHIYKSLKITAVPPQGSNPTTKIAGTTTTSKMITSEVKTTTTDVKTSATNTLIPTRTTISTTTSSTTLTSTTATSTSTTTSSMTSFVIQGLSLSPTTEPPGPTHLTNLKCGCKCRCPDNRMNCRCTCECPAPYQGPLLRGACAPGFTRVCPSQPLECPSDMEHVCPLEIINHVHGITSTVQVFNTTSTISTTSTTTMKPTPPPFIQTKIVKRIRVRSNIFKCSIILTHNHTMVTKSYARCTPSKPRNQKITKLKIYSSNYDFQVNMHINPTKINVAKILRAPATTPPPTTPTPTASTTTTLPDFNENGCDCVADFLLLLYSFPSLDRSLGGDVSLDWSVGQDIENLQNVGGPHISEHYLPLAAQDRDLTGGCYCVQQAKYLTSTAIRTTATTATTPTTAWTPARTSSTNTTAETTETQTTT